MSSGVTKRPYIGPPDFTGLEQRINDSLRGARVDSVIHDEIAYEAAPKHEREIDYSCGLDREELCWAAAYRKVYNVGAGFFERQSKKERDAQRKRTTELAKNGRGVPTAKAAEVLGTVMQYRLEDRVPSSAWPKPGDFKMSPIGRHNDQLDAYRYLLQQMPRPPVKP